METVEKLLQSMEQIESQEDYGSLQEREMTFEIKRKFEGTYSLTTIAQDQVLIIDKIQNLQKSIDEGFGQQLQDHEQILASCQQTEALLQKENLQLRKLLSKTYPAKRMALIAGTILFACVLSIWATVFLKVQVIHPILASIGIFGSMLILGLSYWRNINAE